MEKLDWQRTVQSTLNSVYSLGELINMFTPEQYSQAPVQFLSSGVGGHVRHCLSHFQSLLNGLESGKVDYETRNRGTEEEFSKVKALAALQIFAHAFCERLKLENSGRLLSVFQFLDANGTAVTVPSTLPRELTFVVSHSMHHQAMISVIAHLLNVAVPASCGLAPATIAYFKAQKQCAR